VLLSATQPAHIEFVDCREPGSCQAVDGTRVPPDRRHRALFAEGVTSFIDADLKSPADARRLPDRPTGDDPLYVVTSPHVPLVQGLNVSTARSVAAAEALARTKGRRVAVAEFRLSQASYGADRVPAVDVVISSGTVVPQPRTRSSRPRWKYVSHGFEAYHVYRGRNGQIVFQLQGRAAD